MQYQTDEEKFFQRVLYGSSVLYILLAIIVMVYPLPEKKRDEIAALPPRIAKLILEAPKEEPKPETKPAEEKKEETPEEKAKKAVEKNRETVKKTGLLKALGRDAARGGSLNEILQDREMGEILADVSVLTRAAETAAPTPASSAAVVTASGGGVGSASSIAREMGTGSEIRLAEKKSAAVAAPPRKGQPAQQAGKAGERSRESIAAIAASYRGGIDFIYKKTLRENPLLRGTVTVEFTIAPSGEVTQCKVVSSTVNDPAFETLVVKRILQWKFPPIPGGEKITVTYPLEFSPV